MIRINNIDEEVKITGLQAWQYKQAFEYWFNHNGEPLAEKDRQKLLSYIADLDKIVDVEVPMSVPGESEVGVPTIK